MIYDKRGTEKIELVARPGNPESEDSTVVTPESNRRTGLHFGDKYVSIDQFFREREGKEQDLTAQESIRPR